MNADRLLEHFERISDAADAVPRLRRFVLDLAVRGQLIRSTHTRDVNAAALLESRLPPRKQPTGRTGADLIPVDRSTSPHIPDSWQWARLYQLCDLEAPIVYGILQPGPDIGDHGVPYIRPSEISNGEIELHNIRHTSPEIAARYSRSQICTGDVVFTIVGTLGATATVPEALDGGNITQSSCRLRADKQLIETRYLLAALHSSIVAEQISTFRLGTAVPRLNIAHVRAIAIPLPPLAEQHRIVAKVNELMALCDRLEDAQVEREARRDRLVSASLARVTEPDGDDATSVTARPRFHLDHFARMTTRPEHVKELRQTILNLAVRGRLVPRDEIWQRKPLSELCPLITSGSRGWASFYAKSGAAFIRAQNIRFGLLRLDDLAHVAPPATAETQRCRLQNGDLLIVITGAGVTTPACVDHDLGEAYVSQHVALTRPADASFSPWLLLCLMATQGCRGQLLERAYGAGKPGLNLDNIRTLEVPLPPLAEQRRIVAKVDELMALCDQLEASLASAANERARLLEALLHEALAPAA